MKFVVKQYGQPEYRLGRRYKEDYVWVKEDDYGRFLGSSYYWEFKKGFVALISKKIKDETTVIILYVHGSTIEIYAKKQQCWT